MRRGSRGAAAPRPELVGPAPKTWWNHGIDTVVIGNSQISVHIRHII